MIANFLSVLAVFLVLEGLMPFSSPKRWKQLLSQMLKKDDKVLRIAGFISMLVGVVFLTIIHQFIE